MITKELIDFIKAHKAAGRSDYEIKQSLISAGGWNMGDVEEAFRSLPLSAPVPTAPVAPIQPAVSAQPAQEVQPQQTFSAPQVQLVKSSGVGKKIVVVLAFLLLIGGGAAYAYQSGLLNNLFSPSQGQYEEGNILSGILGKISQIDSSSYTFSGSLKTNQRESGANPFVVPKMDPAIQAGYINDVSRASDVSSILNALFYFSPGSDGARTYPKSLADLEKQNGSQYSSYGSIKQKDLNGQAYVYKVNPDGKGFSLTVQFETQEAVNQIKKYARDAAVAGKKITFTEKSSSYLYVSSTPPVPFIVSLTEYMKSAPANMQFETSVGGTFARPKADGSLTNWRGTFGLSGDFDDLAIQVSVEARKVGEDYYLLINKFPSLFFLSAFTPIKGKWIQFSTKQNASSTVSYGGISSYGMYLARGQQEYANENEKFTQFLKMAVQIADEEKVFAFRERPQTEEKDGQTLYRYELMFNKENVNSYLKRLSVEGNTQNPSGYAELVNADDLSAYLESVEGKELLEYLSENLFFSVWTDKSGMPTNLQTRFRIVPPDTVEHLADKQVDFVVSLALSDINKPIRVEKPDTFITATEADKLLQASSPYDDARTKGTESSIKSSMANARAYAELYYDNNGSTYAGICSSAKDTFRVTLETAQNSTNSTLETTLNTSLSKAGAYNAVTCHATAKAWVAEAPFPSSTKDFPRMYCVDSEGNMMEKTTTLAANSTACRN